MKNHDTLDRVDWASLSGSRGPAIEVPGLLRQLRSSDPQTRLDAFQELLWLLLAEGAIYEAAAPAVPYLRELAMDQRERGRFFAFSLLSEIACGDEQAWMATRPSPSSANLRALVERLSSMTEEDYQEFQRERVAAARNVRERKRRERSAQYATLAGHRDELQRRLAAFDAVRAGVTEYVAALDEDDPYVRMWGAKLLSWFGDEEPEHTVAVRALQALLDNETDERVLAAACMCAGIVGRPGDDPLIARLNELRGHREPPVWAAAAMASAWLDASPDRNVVEAIYACLFEGPDEVDWFPFLEGDMTAMAAATLARLDPGTADDRVAVLVVRWAVADPEKDDLLARAVLDAAFPDGPIAEGTRFAELNPAARAAVEAFRAQDRLDRVATSLLLGSYNLPNSRNALESWMASK